MGDFESFLVCILASVSKRMFSGHELAAVTGYALYRTFGELMRPPVIKAHRLYEE